MANAVNSGHLDDLDDVFSPNVVDHDPAPNQAPGPAGFKHFFATLRDAFPDLNIINIMPNHMDATDDDIAIAYTLSGTHKGNFLGVAPTGKRIHARGMQIARFEDGKIVER
jgi:predicted ester cyclase